MIYSKTITTEGNDCLITRDAHIVAIYDENGSCIGYVATRSTIYRGWMGFDTRSQSAVYDNKEEAIAFCEEYFEFTICNVKKVVNE